MFSVLILTLNEERNLPSCLASVREVSDDAVVLDSGSTDATADLSLAAGARVYTRAFDDFAGQRNFAQEHISFRHDWVFHLDADEHMTSELAAECNAHTGNDNVDGFLVAPKMMFQGKWIPRCTDFPAFQARFVRRHFRFVQVGHGQREHPSMRLGVLRSSYIHALDTGGTGEWLEKHRRYAAAEAAEHLHDPGTYRATQLWSANRLQRRRALKHFSYSLPARPALRFFYQFVLRRGFLDGVAGLRYCRLLSRYEAFCVEEMRQLKRKP